MFKDILRKGYLMIINPELVMEEVRTEKKSWAKWILFLIIFSLFSAPFVMIKTQYGFSNVDWHFSGSAYVDAVRDGYPFFQNMFGDFAARLLIIPLIWFNMILLVLIFSFLVWLVAKYIMKGSGTYYQTCAGLAYAFLPSLIFGAFPYSGILSLTWVGVLQLILMPLVIHKLPLRKAMWFFIVFTAYALYTIAFIGSVVPKV